MKKYLLFIACIFLLCLPSYASGAAVTGENVTAKAGQEVQAVFTVSADEGFMYLSVSPEFDGNALSARVVNGGFMSELTQGKNLIFTADGDVSGNGILCIFTVFISHSAPEGVYEINLKVRECCNENEKDVEVSVIPVRITVSSPSSEWTCVKNGNTLRVNYAPAEGNVLAVCFDGKGRMLFFTPVRIGEYISLPAGAARTKLMIVNDRLSPVFKEKNIV